jgi:hypothetical protein
MNATSLQATIPDKSTFSEGGTVSGGRVMVGPRR